jgi:hypothetical protein
VRPNGLKLRDPGWEGSSGARIRSSEKPGTGDRKVGKGRRRREEQREEGGIYGRREKQRGSCTRAFPDRAAAQPGGSNITTEIIRYFTRLKETSTML